MPWSPIGSTGQRCRWGRRLVRPRLGCSSGWGGWPGPRSQQHVADGGGRHEHAQRSQRQGDAAASPVGIGREHFPDELSQLLGHPAPRFPSRLLTAQSALLQPVQPPVEGGPGDEEVLADPPAREGVVLHVPQDSQPLASGVRSAGLGGSESLLEQHVLGRQVCHLIAQVEHLGLRPGAVPRTPGRLRQAEPSPLACPPGTEHQGLGDEVNRSLPEPHVGPPTRE